MTQQEKDSEDGDAVFAVTREKCTGGAEVEDGSEWADSREDRKNHEKKQSSVVVCKGAWGWGQGGNG
jgi:hypothetical protein